MGDWSLIQGQRYEAIGRDVGNSSLTLLTAGGVAHTKGSYVEFVASSLFDAAGLMVYFAGANASRKYFVDLAVGAVGSEKIIVPDLLYEIGAVGELSVAVLFPISIPAGSRVAGRCQASVASASVRCGAALLGAGFIPGAGLSRVENWGAVPASTSGVSIDPGGTAHTKGAYSELIASTSFDVGALVLAVGYKLQVIGSIQVWRVDVAIGAAGSEKVILVDVPLTVNSASDQLGLCLVGPFPVNIPAGSRVAARAQSSTIVAAACTIDLAAYGVG